MPSTQATGVGDTGTDDAFLDLICSEQDLLAAEFDAIIAAGWSDPPAERPGSGSGGRHPVGRTARCALPVAGRPSRLHAPRGSRRPRERAPPR